MSSSNCCFLICIQISQEAGQVVCYSHLLKNFPQFIVIHTVKGFGIDNKAEVDVFFWNALAFLMIQRTLAIWSLVPLPFLKPTWTSGSSQFMYFWSMAWRILSITLLVWDECNCNDGIYFLVAMLHIVLSVEHVLFKPHNHSINNANPLCRTTLVAQLRKNPPAMQRPRFNSWVGEITWKKEQLPIPVFLPGEFHG